MFVWSVEWQCIIENNFVVFKDIIKVFVAEKWNACFLIFKKYAMTCTKVHCLSHLQGCCSIIIWWKVTKSEYEFCSKQYGFRNMIFYEIKIKYSRIQIKRDMIRSNNQIMKYLHLK